MDENHYHAARRRLAMLRWLGGWRYRYGSIRAISGLNASSAAIGFVWRTLLLQAERVCCWH